MNASRQSSRRFLGPAVALLLLVGTAVTSMRSLPTLAGPPSPTIPQPEPFSIRLERPLTGPGLTVTPFSEPTQITANPGEWYNLDAENFEGGTFPPDGWQSDDGGWQRWSGAGDPKMDTASAGITNTTTMTDNWLKWDLGNLLTANDIANAKFEFSFWLDSQKDVGWFGWVASSDGEFFYGARVSGSVRQWLSGELDLTQYLGDDSVWVAFVFSGGGPGNGVYVDNVTVQGIEPYKTYLPMAVNNYEPPPTSFTFTDNFSNINSGWPQKVVNWDPYMQHIYGYTDKLVADYPNNYNIIGGACRQAGTYFMRVGDETYGYRIVAQAPVQVDGQFTLEADIRFCDEAHGASAGVAFGINDARTQFFRVILIRDAVDDTTKYAVWRDMSQIVSTSGFSHLKGEYETNHIKVVRDECTISIYFNDHLAKTITNQCDYRDRRWVGLFHDRFSIYGLTGALADNFRVEQAFEPSN